MRRRRALVTGATGFIGSNLARHLLKIGWTVDVITRPESDCVLLKDCLQAVKVHNYVGTSASMHEIVDRAQPDVVFHLAALALVQHRSEDISDIINANLLFGTHLVEALSKKGTSPPIVNTGTFWQHHLNSEYNPVNLYAATKKAFENILKFYVETHETRVVTLKLTDTYGPNDPREKLLNVLRMTSGTSRKLSMSPGNQYIDLVHINDVVKAYVVAANRALSFDHGVIEGWSVFSGKSITLRELVSKAERVWNCRIPVEWGARDYRAKEFMFPFSGEKLPGWTPEVDLEKGLAEVGACPGNPDGSDYTPPGAGIP